MFTCWIFLFSLLFARPLVLLARASFHDDYASYVVLVPLISAWVFFIDRGKISVHLTYDRTFGAILLVLAMCLTLSARLISGTPSADLQLSACILSLVLFWISGFAFVFGKVVCKIARFPLIFLFLLVPPPAFLLDRIVSLLQTGSAWIAGMFFNFFGVPVFREGLIFHLANVNIEVARECSGIRSSVAVLIITLLVGHWYLKAIWRKVLFLLAALLIMILKNGVRIASLTLLSMYVDPSFLYGRLHRQGGIIFFILALLLLVPALSVLRWGDDLASRNQGAPLA